MRISRMIVCVLALVLVVPGCRLFADADEVRLQSRDMADGSSMRDIGVDTSDLHGSTDRGGDVGPTACATTGECPGGQECRRLDPSRPERLVCADVVCGCGPTEWCDDQTCIGVPPCTTSAECSGGEVCLADRICGPLCTKNGDCTVGFDCSPLSENQVASAADAGLSSCQQATCRCEQPEDRCDGSRCVHATADCSTDACPPPAGRYTCEAASGACICDGPDCFRDCDNDAACTSFEFCDLASSSCTTQACFDGDDCAAGWVCGFVAGIGRTCSRPGPMPQGAACAGPEDCATGFCETDGTCRQTCRTQSDCPADLKCSALGVSTLSCTDSPACGANCAANQYCTANFIFGGSTCLRTCRTTGECGEDEACSALFPGSGLYPVPSCAPTTVSCADDELYDLVPVECVDACLEDTDCPMGRRCMDYACAIPCAAACDCDPEFACAAWGGCVPPVECSSACEPDAWCDVRNPGQTCDAAANACE